MKSPIAVLAMISLGLLIGCGPKGEPTDPTTAKETPAPVAKEAGPAEPKSGWKRHTAEAGFTLDLPESYKAFDPKDPNLAKAVADAEKENPAMQALLKQSAANQNFVFWALNSADIKDGFAQNLNVIKSPGGDPSANLEEIVKVQRPEMEKQLPPGSKVILMEVEKLPFGECIHSQLELSMQANGKAINVHCHQYLIMRSDGMFTFTYTGLVPDSDKVKEDAKESISTLTFKS